MQAALGETPKKARFNGAFTSIQEFVSPLGDVTELITCPEELDYDEFITKHRKDKTHYVEPCILDLNSNMPNLKDNKLIYATAGSRVRDYVESAKAMFNILKEMIYITAANGRTLDMAVGYTLKEFFSPFISHRIVITEWADQTASLKRARSAVVHGGLATIKECIYFGIPPIVVPLGKDQMDNALRVVDKNVGAMAMLDSLTAEKLYKAIMDAEGNLDIQKSLKEMQAKFKDSEDNPESITHIKTELGIT